MVYDCFTFFNEFELLELRLHELEKVVDKFVLVESNKTHSNLPKPLYFSENKSQYSDFLDRIIHIVVDDMPLGEKPRDHWKRERFQRNAISRGLKGCSPQDIIMVSDIDEIPNAHTVERFCENFTIRDGIFPGLPHRILNAHITRFFLKPFRRKLRKRHPYVWKLEQYLCALYLNRRVRSEEWWYGTRIMHFRDLSCPEEMRHSGYKIIRNGGWHFSYMGDANRIKTKIKATPHQEINNPNSIESILNDAEMNQVFQDVENGIIQILPISELPKFVKDNPEKFSSWIIDTSHIVSDKI